MKTLAWLFVVGIIAGLAYWLWRVKQAWAERQRAAEARYSSMLVTAQVPASAAADRDYLARMGFEAKDDRWVRELAA